MTLALAGFTTGTAATGNVTLTSWTPVDGEYLLLGIVTRNTSLTPSVAGNGQTWVQLSSSPLTNAQGQFEIHVFGTPAVSPSTGSIVVTLAGNTQPAACIAARFSGQHGTPIEATATNAGPPITDDDDMLCAITTVSANAWVIGIGSHRASTFTVPGDETAVSVNLLAGSGGDITTASMWYLPVASPGAVEIGAANDLSQARDWAVYALALAAAAAAGGQPMMLRATTVPGTRQWHPQRVGR